jgi:hypothetical protein
MLGASGGCSFFLSVAAIKFFGFQAALFQQTGEAKFVWLSFFTLFLCIHGNDFSKLPFPLFPSPNYGNRILVS